MWLVVVLGLAAAFAWASEPPRAAPAPPVLTEVEIGLCGAARTNVTPDELRAIENRGYVRTSLRVPVATGDRAAIIDACAAIGL
jgi:hypothetical protein